MPRVGGAHAYDMRRTFDTVVVPITFEPAMPTSLDVDRAVEVRPKQWILASVSTVAALKLAAGLLCEGGTLHLVHATPDFSPSVAIYGPAGLLLPARLDELHVQARNQSLEVLEIFAQRYCEGAPLALHAAPGRPIEVILDVVRSVTANVVVAGASGRGRVERMFAGSTIDKLVRQSPCPVVVVPA